MRIRNLYIHKNCTDVAFRLDRRPHFIPEKQVFEIKCRWFNVVNPNNIFECGNGVDEIEIKAEDVGNWRFYQ